MRRSPSCSTRWALRPTPRSGHIPTTIRSRSCSSPPARLSGMIRSFPWTMGYQPSLPDKVPHLRQAYTGNQAGRKDRSALSERISVKDYLIGLKDGLGADKAGMIVKEASYETSEPTVDSQVVTLQGSGADMSSLSLRRNSPPRRSANPTTWARTRFATSPTCRCRSRPSSSPPASRIQRSYRWLLWQGPNRNHWADDAGLKQWKAFADRICRTQNSSTPMRSTASARRRR